MKKIIEDKNSLLPTIAPKPFASWILDEDTCLWNAPTPMPTDGKAYLWVEEDLNWQEIVIPGE